MPDLLPLGFVATPATWTAADAILAEEAGACRFCGDNQPVAPASVESKAGPATACLHCRALHRLGRPTAAQEGMLIWAPEISQAALNWMVRAVHRVFRAHGESPCLDSRPRSDTKRLRCAWRTYQAWAALAPYAERAVGTTSPHLLGAALLDARRPAPAGLRLLHRGRHFVAGRDVYPDLLDAAKEKCDAE